MASYAGFPEESTDMVFIILDKMDKIGADGVAGELVENGFSREAVDKYMALFTTLGKDASAVRGLFEKLGQEHIKKETVENLAQIMDMVSACKKGGFSLEFDPTLVRGMGYYTGTIFEVSMEGFGGSVAGGGRYDKMIGKFTGKDTPACGFSIGFERIITILLDQKFQIPAREKKAFLFEKGIEVEKMAEILQTADAERNAGNIVLVSGMNKNKKFQKTQLEAEGYTEFREFYREELKK